MIRFDSFPILLRLSSRGGSDFALGHSLCQATDVILEKSVLALESVVVSLDFFDPLGQGL